VRVVIDRLAWVPKADMEPAKEQVLRRQLTVTPRKVGDYPGDAPSPIKLWTETATHYGIPREYYLDNRRDDHEISFEYSMGAKLPSVLPFDGELREEQELHRRYCSGSTGLGQDRVLLLGHCHSERSHVGHRSQGVLDEPVAGAHSAVPA
jgi:hypothetical protein